MLGKYNDPKENTKEKLNKIIYMKRKKLVRYTDLFLP